jgi:hypothetical protein
LDGCDAETLTAYCCYFVVAMLLLTSDCNVGMAQARHDRLYNRHYWTCSLVIGNVINGPCPLLFFRSIHSCCLMMQHREHTRIITVSYPARCSDHSRYISGTRPVLRITVDTSYWQWVLFVGGTLTKQVSCRWIWMSCCGTPLVVVAPDPLLRRPVHDVVVPLLFFR